MSDWACLRRNWRSVWDVVKRRLHVGKMVGALPDHIIARSFANFSAKLLRSWAWSPILNQRSSLAKAHHAKRIGEKPLGVMHSMAEETSRPNYKSGLLNSSVTLSPSLVLAVLGKRHWPQKRLCKCKTLFRQSTGVHSIMHHPWNNFYNSACASSS